MSNYRGYVFRIYPTREQEVQLGKIFSAVHFTYNELLKSWMRDPNVDLPSVLEQLICQHPWLQFIDRSILNHTRINLEKACSQFQREHGIPRSVEKLPQENGRTTQSQSVPCVLHSAPATENPSVQHTEKGRQDHPRFKTRRDSYVSFTISSCDNIFIRYDMLTLGGQRGLKPIRIVQSRPLPRASHICSATVSRHPAGEYFVSILCKLSRDKEPASRGTAAVGLDYSLPSFFVASDPTLIPDETCLHHWARSKEKLAKANRKLSHMVPHSKNYERQRIRIARIHEEIRCQRNDYLQKLSTEIANRYDIVCVETLNLTEMRGRAHNFARSIQDNGWSDFVHMLSYKLEDRGKTLVKVSKWFPSSKLCHECGYLYRGLTLSEREWDCPCCGTHINRDYNASLNIRDEGLRIILQRHQAESGNNTLHLRDRAEYEFPYCSYQHGNSDCREYGFPGPDRMPLLDYLYEDTSTYGAETTDDAEENPGDCSEDSQIRSWDHPFFVSSKEDPGCMQDQQ